MVVYSLKKNHHTHLFGLVAYSERDSTYFIKLRKYFSYYYNRWNKRRFPFYNISFSYYSVDNMRY